MIPIAVDASEMQRHLVPGAEPQTVRDLRVMIQVLAVRSATVSSVELSTVHCPGRIDTRVPDLQSLRRDSSFL